jgi:hypothetical protein
MLQIQLECLEGSVFETGILNSMYPNNLDGVLRFLEATEGLQINTSKRLIHQQFLNT